LNVLIVDDHPIVTAGCRAILSLEHDISVLTARDADDALALYRSARPDVIVVDLNLPGSMSGFDLIKEILVQDPEAQIVVLTMSYDLAHASRAIECGAKGYVGKSEDPERFVAAVRAVAAGRKFVGPDMAQKLAFFDRSHRPVQLSELTPREHEILHLLYQGKSMVEIAAAIQMSYKTVANTCAELKRKLGARSLMDLARIAFENKMT
jgi:two-component system, NarL family, invasion response regulator UvrY